MVTRAFQLTKWIEKGNIHGEVPVVKMGATLEKWIERYKK